MSGLFALGLEKHLSKVGLVKVSRQTLASLRRRQHGHTQGVSFKLLEGVEDRQLLGVAAAEVEIEHAAANPFLHIRSVVGHSKLGEIFSNLELLADDEVEDLGDSLPCVLLVKGLTGWCPPDCVASDIEYILEQFQC